MHSVSHPARRLATILISLGLAAIVDVPGADPIMVYEPRHPEAYDL